MFLFLMSLIPGKTKRVKLGLDFSLEKVLEP